MTDTVDESRLKRAIRAVVSLFDKEGEGHCFPSDAIWEELVGEAIPSLNRPGVIRQLSTGRYIVPTGRRTRAVSGARRSAPTTEYTFGEKISPNSMRLAHQKVDQSEVQDTDQYWSYLNEPPSSTGKSNLEFPLQRILHGCPGSGKSYRLENDARSAHWMIRTVFHPDTRYSDFVGGLRPVSIYKLHDSSNPAIFVGSPFEVPGEPYVQYVVQPGPLLKAYHLACAHPDKSVVLLIEELSRAIAAHVFGDTIQLLDRLGTERSGIPSHYSEYEIEPRADIGGWLIANHVTHPFVQAGRMRFPPNLYIWATMNRSDQNAKQLDSAFLRRWDKKYMSYLESGAYDDTQMLYGGTLTPWSAVRSAVNSKLKGIGGVPEDKFIGPYFLSSHKLGSPEAVAEDLWGYLWNEVLKTRASTFFNATTMAELLVQWDEGRGEPLGPL